MERNARRRLRYIELKLEAYVDELAASGEEVYWLRLLIREIPRNEHRAEWLWEILRDRRQPASISVVSPARADDGVFTMSLIDFSGELCPPPKDESYPVDEELFTSRTSSGKRSSMGRLLAQSHQSYRINMLDIFSRSLEEEAEIAELFIRQTSSVPDPQ